MFDQSFFASFFGPPEPPNRRSYGSGFGHGYSKNDMLENWAQGVGGVGIGDVASLHSIPQRLYSVGQMNPIGVHYGKGRDERSGIRFTDDMTVERAQKLTERFRLHYPKLQQFILKNGGRIFTSSIPSFQHAFQSEDRTRRAILHADQLQPLETVEVCLQSGHDSKFLCETWTMSETDLRPQYSTDPHWMSIQKACRILAARPGLWDTFVFAGGGPGIRIRSNERFHGLCVRRGRIEKWMGWRPPEPGETIGLTDTGEAVNQGREATLIVNHRGAVLKSGDEIYHPRASWSLEEVLFHEAAIAQKSQANDWLAHPEETARETHTGYWKNDVFATYKKYIDQHYGTLGPSVVSDPYGMGGNDVTTNPCGETALKPATNCVAMPQTKFQMGQSVLTPSGRPGHITAVDSGIPNIYFVDTGSIATSHSWTESELREQDTKTPRDLVLIAAGGTVLILAALAAFLGVVLLFLSEQGDKISFLNIQ